MHQTLRNAYHRLAAAASVALIALMTTPTACMNSTHRAVSW